MWSLLSLVLAATSNITYQVCELTFPFVGDLVPFSELLVAYVYTQQIIDHIMYPNKHVTRL
jgi:hypothetical protein